MNAVHSTQAWVAAMGAPSLEWAANDLTEIVREIDETCTRLGKVYDLIARAGDDGLLAYADVAHNAAWRLVDGLDAVAGDLTRAAREVRPWVTSPGG